jgi:hypothetical protein
MIKKSFTAYCFYFLAIVLSVFSATAQHNPEFSKAGFYPLENTLLFVHLKNKLIIQPPYQFYHIC